MNKFQEQYHELYEKTDLSTTQMITKISFETRFSERIVAEQLGDVPKRYSGNDKPQVERAYFLQVMEKHLKKYPFNRAAQMTALELDMTRSNCIQRWRRLNG